MDKTAALKGKQILVVGLGISGRSAARFLLHAGARVEAVEDKWEELNGHPEIVALMAQGLQRVTLGGLSDSTALVVVSPGVPAHHPAVEWARRRGIEVIGEIELACRHISNTMVGITGTNGKTTVTLLTEHVLKSAGIQARALGNSGVPLTSVFFEAPQDGEVFVVELSSFQLETLKARCLDAAVLLNITPDHLDRYSTMAAYAAAKLKIRDALKERAPFFADERSVQDYCIKDVYTYGYKEDSFLYTDLKKVYIQGEKVFDLPEKIQGRRTHEGENLLAAFALCRACGLTGAQFIQGAATFKKPAHRIEFVRQCGGIAFVDDSKGTNLDAVIRAVQCVDGPVVLIAGGVDKGASYRPWIEAFAGKVCCICAIGQASEKIEREVGREIPTRLYQNLEEAVRAAAACAQPGGTVLLSPGCSSYDMFKDYAHRGDEFKRLVLAL